MATLDTNSSAAPSETSPSTAPSSTQVLQELHGFLKQRSGDDDTSSSSSSNDDLFDMSVMATPVAAIKALLGVVQRSNANTMMELQDELKQAREDILSHNYKGTSIAGVNRIGLASGCDLFLRYATRTFLEFPDFATSRNEVLERGQRFASLSLAARDRIVSIMKVKRVYCVLSQSLTSYVSFSPCRPTWPPISSRKDRPS